MAIVGTILLWAFLAIVAGLVIFRLIIRWILRKGYSELQQSSPPVWSVELQSRSPRSE